MVVVTLGVSLSTPVADVHASTGSDGLIAIATLNGIEVFDSSGDGSDMHVLIPNPPGDARLHEPAWSPRGTLIAYQYKFGVWVARADGTDAHRVSLHGEIARDASWSPDGRLSFNAGGGVVIVDPDGTHRTFVDARGFHCDGPCIHGRPAWTADGRLMLLIGAEGLAARPFIADGDGTHLRPLTHPDGTTPNFADVSFNWQFSSTGLVAYDAIHDPARWWVHLSSFDGTHIVEAPSDVAADLLDGSSDVALSPSGRRAATTVTGRPHVNMVSLWTVGLTSSTESVHGTGEVPFPGKVLGLDWQPQCSITGTADDDELTGTPGPDLICGLGGDDVIDGVGANDVIYGGAGRDLIAGGLGNDVLVGGRETDTILGGPGNDLINSRRDPLVADTVGGSRGHDVCIHDAADVLRSC